MIRKEKFTFRSVLGQELDARAWFPEGEPKGIIQMVHGMAEHIDRYDGPGTAFAEAGYIAVGHTHLGHGPKGQILGYFGPEHGWQNLLDDVHALRLRTEKEHPGLPYILLGHSMGSFVVRCYLLQHAEGLAGAILSGTGYFAPGTVRSGLALAKIQCAFGLAKKPSKLINAIGFSSSNKAFEPVRTKSDWLSRDEGTVDAYEADPLCGFMFTASGYKDMFTGLDMLSRTEDLRKIPKDLPVLFFSGDRDPVGDQGAGVKTVADQFRAAGVKDVTVTLYPDGRHEMFNELNRQEVYADVVRWMDGVIAGR